MVGDAYGDKGGEHRQGCQRGRARPEGFSERAYDGADEDDAGDGDGLEVENVAPADASAGCVRVQFGSQRLSALVE